MSDAVIVAGPPPAAARARSATGETENGRSIKVISSDLPGNSNLAMAQEAASPNTTLNGTAIAATVSVRRIALQASGSRNASRKAPIPFEKAWVKTAKSGKTRNSARKVTAIPISTPRVTAPSEAAWAGLSAGTETGEKISDIAEPPP